MFSKSCSRRKSWHSHMSAMKPSGNSAFDAYKSDTLARLEREQQEIRFLLEDAQRNRDKDAERMYYEQTVPATSALLLIQKELKQQARF